MALPILGRRCAGMQRMSCPGLQSEWGQAWRPRLVAWRLQKTSGRRQMKFCTFPFEYFYIDNYKGNVALCPWMHRDALIVGNVFTQTLDAIWHGEKANRLRARIRQGDYSMCRPDGCPFLQNNNLPDKPADFVAAYRRRKVAT